MARTVAGLPEGLRLTDHISLGVITKTFPMVRVKEILRAHGRTKRKMSNYPIRPRHRPTPHLMNIERCVKILK